MSGIKQVMVLALIALCGVGGSVWYWQTQPTTDTTDLTAAVAEQEAATQGLVDDLNNIKQGAESEAAETAKRKAAVTDSALTSADINQINSGILQATDLGASYNGKQVLVRPLTNAMDERIQTSQTSADKEGYLSKTVAPSLRQISETHNDVTTVLVDNNGETVIVIEDGQVSYHF